MHRRHQPHQPLCGCIDYDDPQVGGIHRRAQLRQGDRVVDGPVMHVEQAGSSVSPWLCSSTIVMLPARIARMTP